MVNIEEVWHAFVQKLENLRHHVDPALHADLDEVALHAATLKTAAEGAVQQAVAGSAPFVAAAVKGVEEETLKAAQSVETAAKDAVTGTATEILK